MFREQTSSQKISALSTNDRWLWCYFVSSFHGATGQTTHFKDYWIDLFPRAAESTWKESTKKEKRNILRQKKHNIPCVWCIRSDWKWPERKKSQEKFENSLNVLCFSQQSKLRNISFDSVSVRWLLFRLRAEENIFFFSRIQNRNSVNVETFRKLTTDHAVHMRLLTEYFYQL